MKIKRVLHNLLLQKKKIVGNEKANLIAKY